MHVDVNNMGHYPLLNDCKSTDEDVNDFNKSGTCARKKAYLDNATSKLGITYKSAVGLMASFVLKHVLLNRRKIKKTWRTLGVVVGLGALFVYLELSCAVLEKCFESSFSVGFHYPSYFHDFPSVVSRFRAYKKKGDDETDFVPHPINPAYSQVPFIYKADPVLNGSAGLVIVVKSATRNYKKRKAIRQTWGSTQYLKQTFLAPHLPTKLAFICGIPGDFQEGSELFPDEMHFGDIILGDFRDIYENNTFKTMLALRWATEEVQDFRFLMIIDDDMYLNPANVISFIQDIPTVKVSQVVSNDSGVPAFYLSDDVSTTSDNSTSLKGKPVIMGEMHVDSKPYRNILGSGSKWSVSLTEYPYNFFPPYIAGGATLIDNATVSDLYYASFFTKHCWIDDVYIGILAYKLGITLTDTDYIDSSYRGNLQTRLRDNFDKILAFHGLQCPEQLVQLWSTMDVEALRDCYYISDIML